MLRPGHSRAEDELRVKLLAESIVKKQIEEEQKTYMSRQVAVSKAAAKEVGTANHAIGQYRGRVDSRTYARFEQAFPGCWHDPKFVDEYFKRNPEANIKNFL